MMSELKIQYLRDRPANKVTGEMLIWIEKVA
jgi:hypothetical protein